MTTTTKPKVKPVRIVLYSLIAFICICGVVFANSIKNTPPAVMPTGTPTQTLQPTNTPITTSTVNQAGAKLTPANTPTLTNTPQPTATFDPHAAITTQIRAILGTGNRDVSRIAAINFDDPESGAIFINWALNDNIIQSWIGDEARDEATQIIRAIHNSGIDYTYVMLSGSFSMVDKFGNTSEENIFNLTFNRSTVEKINWSNFNSANIDDIADSAFVHPEIQGDR